MTPNIDPVAVEQEMRVRHRARGTEYTVIGVGRSQGQLQDEDPVVIYRGDDGGLWARHQAEFCDGRFEQLPATLRSPTSSEGLREALLGPGDPEELAALLGRFGWLSALFADLKGNSDAMASLAKDDPDAHWEAMREVEELIAETRKAISTPAAQAVEGLVMVPREPTEAMIRALDKGLHNKWPNARAMALAAWEAMLSAITTIRSPHPEETSPSTEREALERIAAAFVNARGQRHSDYGEVLGENFQMMTMHPDPEALAADLNRLPEIIRAVDRHLGRAMLNAASSPTAQAVKPTTDDEIVCVGCSRRVLIGHFVNAFDDVGEVHCDCENPFLLPKKPTIDDGREMSTYVMAGRPMIRVPVKIGPPAPVAQAAEGMMMVPRDRLDAIERRAMLDDEESTEWQIGFASAILRIRRLNAASSNSMSGGEVSHG